MHDELDAMEAEESVTTHLSMLHKKEVELAEEERTLRAEKEAHIRELKRVASEDASRFKSRPKVRGDFFCSQCHLALRCPSLFASSRDYFLPRFILSPSSLSTFAAAQPIYPSLHAWQGWLLGGLAGL